MATRHNFKLHGWIDILQWQYNTLAICITG